YRLHLLGRKDRVDPLNDELPQDHLPPRRDHEVDGHFVLLLVDRLDVRLHHRPVKAVVAVVQLDPRDVLREHAQIEEMLLPADVDERKTDGKEQDPAPARPCLNDRAERISGDTDVSGEGHPLNSVPLQLRESGKGSGGRLPGSTRTEQEQREGGRSPKATAIPRWTARTGSERHDVVKRDGEFRGNGCWSTAAGRSPET